MNGGQEKDVVEEKEVGKEEAKEKAKEKPPKEKVKEKERDRGLHHGHKVHGVPRARTLPTNLKRYVLFTSMETVGMETIAT